MTSWKTTLAGLLAGLPLVIDALLTAFKAGAFTGKTALQITFAVGLILVGVYAKDKGVTGVSK